MHFLKYHYVMSVMSYITYGFGRARPFDTRNTTKSANSNLSMTTMTTATILILLPLLLLSTICGMQHVDVRFFAMYRCLRKASGAL